MKHIRLVVLLAFVFAFSAALTAMPQPLKGFLIMLDAGHGGADSGAVGPTGLKESDVNLRVAKYLGALLEADGASVVFTRDFDVTLSLSQRVEMAERFMPDLFVSIHHNASLQKINADRAEIYYNAIDRGVSKRIGDSMLENLIDMGFGDKSVIIPGGFFVLRNNPVPAVLSEGAYITLPDTEKRLRTGKALTDQAQSLRRAIKEAFQDVMRVNFMLANHDVSIDTPFFNIIFTCDRPLQSLSVRSAPQKIGGFDFEPIFGAPNTYRFYNTAPLSAGKYELQVTFFGKDGSVSPRKRLNVTANLPFGRCEIAPVAPFIAKGFKGRFPIRVTMKDTLGRLNRRDIAAVLRHGDRLANAGDIANGIDTFYIDLDGAETNPLRLELSADSFVVATSEIAVAEPIGRYVLGRVINEKGQGVANTKIDYGAKKPVITDVHGFFYLEYPKLYTNMRLNIVPPMGYFAAEHTLRQGAEPVSLPVIELNKKAPALFGKKIGIIAPLSLDLEVRRLVRSLMSVGANVVRLPVAKDDTKPRYQAALEANLISDLDVVFSFKRHEGEGVAFRHYHSSKRGKRLALRAKANILKTGSGIKVSAAAGSDYELGNIGATALVVSFSDKIQPKFALAAIDGIAAALKAKY